MFLRFGLFFFVYGLFEVALIRLRLNFNAGAS